MRPVHPRRPKQTFKTEIGVGKTRNRQNVTFLGVQTRWAECEMGAKPLGGSSQAFEGRAAKAAVNCRRPVLLIAITPRESIRTCGGSTLLWRKRAIVGWMATAAAMDDGIRRIGPQDFELIRLIGKVRLIVVKRAPFAQSLPT